MLKDRGLINASMTSMLMSHLKDIGVLTHLVEVSHPREHQVHAVHAFPFFLQIHNAASLRMQDTLDIAPQTPLEQPILDAGLKRFEREEAWFGQDHAFALGWCTLEEWAEMRHISLRVNDFLRGYYEGLGFELLYFRLEFGRPVHREKGTVMLCDELSLETCCFRDRRTGYLHRPHFENQEDDVHWDQRLVQRLGLVAPVSQQRSVYRSGLSLVKS